MNDFTNLIDVLRHHCNIKKDELLYRYIEDELKEPLCLSFAQVNEEAKAIAHNLLKTCTKGDRALMLYPSGLEFITAFLGCLYAGLVAVPAYPPRKNQKLSRLKSIVSDADAAIIMTVKRSALISKPLFENDESLASLPWFVTDDFDMNFCEDIDTDIQDDDIAFLQYTSGSTGEPKGVMITHKNIMSNMESIYQSFSSSTNRVGVSWLPHFHDMGLIGGVLQPLYGGFEVTLMAPAYFLQKPIRWLEAISKYKGTTSGGPNFAFDLCVDTIKDEQLIGLDLSSWKLAFNGAEPVQASTLKRFSEKFKNCGFEHSSHYPCYGMAETTLIIAGGESKKEAHHLRINKKQLQVGKVVKDENKEYSQEMVSSGFSWLDHELILVNPSTQCKVNDGEVAEVWVKGRSVAKGYWKNPLKTEETFKAYTDDKKGPYLRTGDLGFYHDNELYICGREKDLLIIRGRNFYPQDIEELSFNVHEALMGGSCAAFSVSIDNEEKLVIAQEIKRTYLRKADMQELFRLIKQKVALELEVQVYDIVLLKPGQLLKTSSGKIQRQANKKAYETQTLKSIIKLSEEKSQKEDEHALVFSEDSYKNLLMRDKHAYLSQSLKTAAAKITKGRIDSINTRVSLLENGLDSLAMTRFLSHLQDYYLLDLSLDTLFRLESMQELIELVIDKLDNDKAHSFKKIQAISQEEASLSYAQERLWFLDHLEEPGNNYHVPGILNLEGKINITALEDALKTVIKRHEAIRTNFIKKDNVIIQEVNEEVDFSLTQRNSTQEDLDAHIQDALQKPFELSSDLLFRAHLFIINEGNAKLLINMHHIISDGWSIGVLVKEFVSIYNAYDNKQKNPLPDLKIQYRDFAAWQKEYLQGPVLEEKLSFWKNELKDVAHLELPSSYPRPSIQSHKGNNISFEIDAKVLNKLKTLNKEQGNTLYMSLLAAFSVLMHRYSGQDDIVIGSPIANRNRSDIEALIGFFVNTLVMRQDYSESPNFIELLQQVKRRTLNSYDQQDAPFERVVDALGIERVSSHTPLIQVLFILQNNEKSHFNLEHLKIDLKEVDNATSKFDLALSMHEDEEKLFASIQYATDLFSESYIHEMIYSFQTLLAAIVDNPKEKVSHYPLLDLAAKEEQIVHFNQSSFAYESKSLIHELFELQVEKTPDAMALVYEDEGLSYKDLNEKANRLAFHLRACGLKENTLVALCLERSLDMMVSILAVLKSGCAYVPIDPLYPKERIEYILEDAHAQILLTQDVISSNMPNIKEKICVDALDLEALSGENLGLDMSSQDLAYVIYTSGSTGRPKGVMVEHKALVNSTLAREEVYVQDMKNTTLLIPSYAFDASVAAIWESLIFSGTLVILSSQDQNDIFAIANKIQKHKVNRTLCVSTVYQALLQAPECIDRLDSLQSVSVGGESVDKLLIELSHKHLPAVRLFNEYGPTEATVWSSFAEITQGSIKKEYYEHGIIPIGKPINNTRLYILDKQLSLVPKGVSGELHISGDGLARGYLNQQTLSDEKYINNPFETNSKMYKTGDLVRYLPDGNIQYLGRIDEQVKVRGFRIELGEIESLVNQIPGIQSSLALVSKEHNSSIHLFCEKEAGCDADVDEVNHEVTDMWENIFDAKYEEILDDDEDEFNITGWKSSYTGEDIPNEQMQGWVQATADLVQSTGGKYIFEIGCGSGLILYKLHENIHHYHGIDISKNTILKLEKSLQKREMKNISLDCATADNFVIPKGTKVDTVLINSVIQYFPNAHYLDEVIKRSIEALSFKQGKVIIGDVLNLRLQEAFYYSLIQYNETKTLSTQELIEMIDMKKISEEELFVDPSYFVLLKDKFKAIKDIKIHLKHELDDNEMNNFRFDVILDIDKENIEINSREVILNHYEFGLGDTLSSIKDYINTSNDVVVKISNIPNKKLIQEKSISDLRQSREEKRDDALYVNELYKSLQKDSFDFEISPSENNKYFDVLINKTDKEISFYSYQAVSEYSHKLTNNSSLSNMFLIDDIKEKLERYLPAYMIPSRIKMIESFPLTPNGKIDKKALLKLEDANQSTQEYVAPRDEKEAILVKAFEKVLNVDRVGIYHNFFELGGNSILTVQLVSLVKASGIAMDVKDIFQAQNVAELSAYLQSDKAGELVDLNLEAYIEDDMQVLHSENETFEHCDILLTGATGFVGRYLLHEILNRTEAKIYCLVRASNEESGFERIKRSLCDYNLWEESFKERIAVVLGDLAEEKFGLNDTVYASLSHNISQVYHCATYMNHLASFEFLKKVNVEGLKEILYFASHNRDKKIEYISTIGVFNEHGDKKFDEHTSLHEQKHFKSSGYSASKYVAEEICFLAQERGFNLNIYRLGLITGDKIIGKNDETQWFQQLLEAGMKLSCMFDVKGFDIPIAPVDFVVDSIFSLANSSHTNKVYHLTNSSSLGLDALLQMYNSSENTLEKVSLYTFTQRLKAYNETQEYLSISTFFTKYIDFNEEAFKALEYEAAKTRNKILMEETLGTLRELGIHFPEINKRLIRKYFNSSTGNILTDIQLNESLLTNK
ncbi:amino acid adenylation domain-containing protein [Sulfurimonas sp. MAG313]|nr:non-ribosomal peptide synthetase [Sulfurimonas sp. MAG313]MDF1882138.1 amino acid adenylation domain-containing protein [Sulfurimonas sp. MAG313]